MQPETEEEIKKKYFCFSDWPRRNQRAIPAPTKSAKSGEKKVLFVIWEAKNLERRILRNEGCLTGRRKVAPGLSACCCWTPPGAPCDWRWTAWWDLENGGWGLWSLLHPRLSWSSLLSASRKIFCSKTGAGIAWLGVRFEAVEILLTSCWCAERRCLGSGRQSDKNRRFWKKTWSTRFNLISEVEYCIKSSL